VLDASHSLIARVWRRARLQPQRPEHHMLSDDPNLERKTADVIGFHPNPPQHAAVSAAVQKTAIQAPDRLDPELSLSPERGGSLSFRIMPVRHPAGLGRPKRPHGGEPRSNRTTAHQP
jgi:hypothetical protein